MDNTRYFEHLVEHSLAICKECRYAVWPNQIEGHLREQHQTPRKEAQIEAECIRKWPGLIQYPSELFYPSCVVKPFTQLSLYSDGLKCQLEPMHCQYTVRSLKTLKEHWRKNHGWSASQKPGRPSRTKEKKIQAQMDQGFKRVHCQRFFGSRHGSQYFEVQSFVEGQSNQPHPVPVDSNTAWVRVGEQMAKAWAHVETQVQNTIQAGEKDEVNP